MEAVIKFCRAKTHALMSGNIKVVFIQGREVRRCLACWNESRCRVQQHARAVKQSAKLIDAPNEILNSMSFALLRKHLKAAKTEAAQLQKKQRALDARTETLNQALLATAAEKERALKQRQRVAALQAKLTTFVEARKHEGGNWLEAETVEPDDDKEAEVMSGQPALTESPHGELLSMLKLQAKLGASLQKLREVSAKFASNPAITDDELQQLAPKETT